MFQNDLLKGQRILVTGGGTGLGRAMGEQFLRLGADLVICGRRKGVLDEAAEQMQENCGGQVETFGVDIRDAQAVEAMVDEIFAERPLTGLVNNAAGNFISPTEALSSRAFDAIANIVFHGSFYVTNAVGKHWIDATKKAGGWQPGQPMRSVMSIIVTWVENGGPFVVPSAMSKAGIATMTRSLASEWARYGIRLNAVGPGVIPTEGMSKRLNPGEDPQARAKAGNPMRRVGDMSELQNLASFLMSGGCDWLTGQLIFMDGANYLANGGNFYPLHEWTDDQWREARERIEAQNARDRAQRG
ncbi:MAG TPA: SDR family oxidoreductase [Burkholderiaceae bacterium]|nr:SDR family oxidoreductase [Burkholderiaceae bacterium]